MSKTTSYSTNTRVADTVGTAHLDTRACTAASTAG
jgi:hypothetical protein